MAVTIALPADRNELSQEDVLTAPTQSMTDAELDALFGQALRPDRIDPLEIERSPLSAQALDAETAALLRDLMRLTLAGLGIVRYVYCELPILWLVDREGTLRFAVEEIYDPISQEFVWPRLREAAIGTLYQRLGHPSLVKVDAGRIGGELLFDIDASPPAWVLTNRSGRYGLRAGRTAEHLSNAAKEFATFGIVLNEFFYTPE